MIKYFLFFVAGVGFLIVSQAQEVVFANFQEISPRHIPNGKNTWMGWMDLINQEIVDEIKKVE